MTTAPLLHSGDKDLEEIQQIVTSIEAANMAKQPTGQTADLAMAAKKKSDGRQQPKTRTTEECFNCGKRGQYAKDCRSATKRKPEDEKAAEEMKRARWNRNRAAEKAAAARSADQDDSDAEPYPAGRAFMIRHSSSKPNDTWYLDSCASKHICKNRELFSDLRPKNYEFITAGGEVIRSREVGTVYFSLQSGKMTLLNVAYTPKCDSNLISLG